MTSTRLTLLALSLAILSGCTQQPPPPQAKQANNAGGSNSSIVFINVTSDATEKPQSMDMAMKIAGFSVDEERQVVMFFNVKGVLCPTSGFKDDFAFGDNDPIKTQLKKLIERGVDVHVCPICMKALGVEEGDLIEGAKVTTRPSLFANIGPDTAVFTY